jgi:hypothetical protein
MCPSVSMVLASGVGPAFGAASGPVDRESGFAIDAPAPASVVTAERAVLVAAAGLVRSSLAELARVRDGFNFGGGAAGWHAVKNRSPGSR